MRSSLRLLVAIILGVAMIAAVIVAVPLTVRSVYRHGSTTVENVLPSIRSGYHEQSSIYARNGALLYQMEPQKAQKPVALSQIAPILVHAVLDTEDVRFYKHGGVDFRSLIRAFFNDSGGGGIQGGSTITQQLVKNIYLSPQRTISRKLKEAVLANRLEQHYTKDQILTAYLNTIFLGSNAYGVEAASENYFGIPASKVNLAQAALLAGLIQAPSGDDPIFNPQNARYRRAQVLDHMLQYHTINNAQYQAAINFPLPTATHLSAAPITGTDGYYIQQVISILQNTPILGKTQAERNARLAAGGFKIYTNLNPTAQAEAVAAVNDQTAFANPTFEENMVSMNPQTGNVVALVGGPNYATQKVDVATQGLRQAGSGFKIFTLLADLSAGVNVYDPVDATGGCPIPFPGNDAYVISPGQNDEGDVGAGMTNVVNATGQSLNCAYLRMAHLVGLPAVVHEAEKLGIPASEMDSVKTNGVWDPSLILGTAGVTPLQMSAAYATVASGGIYHFPHFISKIVNRAGKVIYQEPATGHRVLTPEVAAEADVAFQATVTSGTCTGAAIPGREVAGKTGTTTGPSDAWFNGFTPQLETTVWMGDPTSEAHLLQDVGAYAEVYGGDYPCSTVHQFMEAYLQGKPLRYFPTVDSALLPPESEIPEVARSVGQGKTVATTSG